MSRQAKRLYEFGPFRLDPENLRLLRGGKTVPLTPKATEMLLVCPVSLLSGGSLLPPCEPSAQSQ